MLNLSFFFIGLTNTWSVCVSIHPSSRRLLCQKSLYLRQPPPTWDMLKMSAALLPRSPSLEVRLAASCRSSRRCALTWMRSKDFNFSYIYWDLSAYQKSCSLVSVFNSAYCGCVLLPCPVRFNLLCLWKYFLKTVGIKIYLFIFCFVLFLAPDQNMSPLTLTMCFSCITLLHSLHLAWSRAFIKMGKAV